MADEQGNCTCDKGRMDHSGAVEFNPNLRASQPPSLMPYEINIKQVNGNRGYIVTVGCRTFVFETWLAMATALGDYQASPVEIARHLAKKYGWTLDERLNVPLNPNPPANPTLNGPPDQPA